MEGARLSLTQKINVVCALCASVYLIYISVFPLIYIFTVEFSRLSLIQHTIILLIGIGTGLGAFSMVQQALLFNTKIDAMFEKGIYRRLQPMLKEVAKVQLGLDETAHRMQTIESSINSLKKAVDDALVGRMPMRGDMTYSSDPILFLIKIVVLINVTFAAFVFMVQFPWVYLPYVATAVYFMWWLALTSEYGLWRNTGIYVWGFVPILIVPSATIIMTILLPREIMLGTLYIALGIYAYAYYAWSTYMMRGRLPGMIHDLLQEISTKSKIERL